MPAYLVHGFRWARGAIRIHIALYDIDDAAAEWIIAPASSVALLNSFYALFDFLPSRKSSLAAAGNPSVAGPRPRFNDWSMVKLLEQYDPADESVGSQPYAYVADYIVPVVLSTDVAAEMDAYDEHQRAEASPPGEPGLSGLEMRRCQGWFEKMRDKLQKDAAIGWYVVVCGDEEREYIAGPKVTKSAGLRGLFGKREMSASSKRDHLIRE
jgi:hypothetical protein